MDTKLIVSKEIKRMTEMTYDEALEAVNGVFLQLKSDKEQVDRLAESFGFLERIKSRTYIYSRLVKVFPLVEFFGDVTYEKNEEIARKIADWKYLTFLKVANAVETVYPKKRTVKLAHDFTFSLPSLLRYFGIKKTDYTKETQANKKVVLKFARNDKFEAFMEIITWKSKETETALEGMTEEAIRDGFDKEVESEIFVYSCKAKKKAEDVKPSELPKSYTEDLLDRTMYKASMLYDSKVNHYLLKQKAQTYVDKFKKEVGIK